MSMVRCGHTISSPKTGDDTTQAAELQTAVVPVHKAQALPETDGKAVKCSSFKMPVLGHVLVQQPIGICAFEYPKQAACSHACCANERRQNSAQPT